MSQLPDRVESIDMNTRLGRVALQLLTVEEAGALLRVSRWQMYQLINSGKLRSVKIARRRLITQEDLQAYIDSLRTQSEATR